MSRHIQLLDKEKTVNINIDYNTDGSYTVQIGNYSVNAWSVRFYHFFTSFSGSLNGSDMRMLLGDRLFNCTVVINDTQLHLFVGGKCYTLTLPVKDYSGIFEFIMSYVVGETSAKGSLLSPMPGRIAKVLVQPNQKVEKGTPLIIMEAMKMEVSYACSALIFTAHYQGSN